MGMSDDYGVITKELAAAWCSATGGYDGYLPVFFDERRGLLIVECINKAWQVQLRLLGPKVIERMNAALPAPIVQGLLPAVREARILVTGSRSWTDTATIHDALLNACYDATQAIDRDIRCVIVHGDCPKGADAIAKQWAIDNEVMHEPHPADWSAHCGETCLLSTHRKTSAKHGEYCPRAGHRRNQLMVDLGADIVLAFHQDKSRGTADLIARAKKAGIPVIVHTHHLEVTDV
jgi:hypothetical protein